MILMGMGSEDLIAAHPISQVAQTGRRMQPLTVEVFFPIPEAWGLCQTCTPIMAEANMNTAIHAETWNEALPPEWKQDLDRLVEVIDQLSATWGTRIVIRVVDPRSLTGLAKSFRYRARRYPTFVVSGREKIVGFDLQGLDKAIRSVLAGDTINY